MRRKEEWLRWIPLVACASPLAMSACGGSDGDGASADQVGGAPSASSDDELDDPTDDEGMQDEDEPTDGDSSMGGAGSTCTPSTDDEQACNGSDDDCDGTVDEGCESGSGSACDFALNESSPVETFNLGLEYSQSTDNHGQPALASGEADRICFAAYDDDRQELQFSLYDPSGEQPTRIASFSRRRDLVDLAYDGSSCFALTINTEERDTSGPLPSSPYSFLLTRWNAEDDVVDSVSFGGGLYSRALDPISDAQAIGSVWGDGDSVYAVGYEEHAPPIADPFTSVTVLRYDASFEETTASEGWSTEVTGELLLTPSVSVGPPLDDETEASLVYKDDEQELRVLGLEPEGSIRSYGGLTTAGALNDVYRQDVGGASFVSWWTGDSDAVELHRIEQDEAAWSTELVASREASGIFSGASLFNRATVSEGPRSDAWLLNAYQEEVVVVPLADAAASPRSLERSEQTDSIPLASTAVGDEQHLLSLRSARSDGTPFSFQVDAYSCD